MADDDKSGRGPRGPRSGNDRQRSTRAKGTGTKGTGTKGTGGKRFGAGAGGEGRSRDKAPDGKPAGGKSFGSKSFGGKPAGGKSFAGKPHGGKPGGRFGDRPDRDAKPEGERRFSKPRDGERAAARDGEGKPLRSHGFRDRPGAGSNRPAGAPEGKPVSRGYRDRPGGGEAPRPRPRRDDDGAGRSRPFADRKPREDRAPSGTAEGEAPRNIERIAKRLARAGVSSRREAEGLIADGRVKVNGRVLASPAVNVSDRDVILIDGKPIPEVERTRLWLFHKPAGLVTSNRDPEGRPTIFDKLPSDLPRVVTIGRLDINTEGLLLLTNDGGLARILELPQTGWLRRYRVRAHGRITQERLDELKNGIAVDGVFYGAIEAVLEREQGSNVWIEIGLREGKNREVKNVMGALGLEVNRLIRVSYGPFQLGALEEAAVMEIKGRTLQEQLGERLIEEAGANFDAPVLRSFPNRPVRQADEAPKPMTAEKRGDWVSGTRDPRAKPGAGGKPRRMMKPEERREEARDRLTTKKPEGPARGPRKGDRDERPAPERGGRGANVWMAPGARPAGKAKPARDKPDAGTGRPRTAGGAGPRSGKPRPPRKG